MPWTIGVDIGGTFTDITVVGSDGRELLWKEDSTPGRLGDAISAGLAAVARELGLTLGDLLADTERFVHGSTVATNTLIERTGPKTALICTAGFRDALYFRDGFKWDRYNTALPRPADLVPRYLRLGVSERIGSDGLVITPLDEATVRLAAQFFAAQGVGAIAVALLWSLVNPAHEQRVREILAAELPGVPALLSSEILPEVGEWVRTSATVLSAYVYPQTAAYLGELETWLAANGLPRELLVMQLNGGCARVERALRVPVNIIASGPAAAPAAARQVARRVTTPDAITVDMGGTSFDACLMRNGEIPLSRTEFVAHQPLGVPAVEIHSIGAGGGSVGWVDSGGALRVGPESAGARPGPAAYDGGGDRPTVTDANIVLGYLSTDNFLGGRRTLRGDLSAQAIERHITIPLGLPTVHEAAAGMIRIVDENMVNAIRRITIERGIDPRPCVLISGGGAGSLHAGRLAATLGIREVIIPSQAGTLSAFGMTVTDVRHDYSAVLHTTTASPDWDAVANLLATMETQARAELARSGFAPTATRIERSVDARYVGQIHELTTRVAGEHLDRGVFEALRARFDETHRQRYTYSLPGNPVEYLHWRVSGVSVTSRPATARFAAVDAGAATATPTGTRRAYFPELAAFADTPVFDSRALARGAVVNGPAIVESSTTTILVVPGQRVLADGEQNHLLTLDVAG